MTTSIIVAITRMGIIAAGGKIPWKCPADMRHFGKHAYWKQTERKNYVGFKLLVFEKVRDEYQLENSINYFSHFWKSNPDKNNL